MTTGTTADRAYLALAELRQNLPYVRAALVPGTPRRTPSGGIGARALAALDQLIRAERAERIEQQARGIKVLGESPAPLVLSVLDSERHIVESVARLEVQACEWLGLTPLAGADVLGRIARLIGLLGRLEAHAPWIEHVAGEAGRLARRAARAIGDVEPVTTFSARCPLCRARSLRALPEREIIICANDACPCSVPVSCSHFGPHHVWRYGDAAMADLRESA